MERLTIRDRENNALLAPEHEERHTAEELIDLLLSRLAAYEDTGLTPEEIEHLRKEYRSIASQLTDYRAAHVQGRLVDIPFEIGQTVYYIGTKNGNAPGVFPDVVYEVGADVYARTYNGVFSPDKIGKTVFLTLNDAEKALREREG